MRRPVVELVLVVCVVVAAACAAASPVQRRRPNVVVFVVDDLGYGDVSPFGNGTIKTPHLDELARSGVRLEQAYAADPVCTPSRAALLTGQYAPRSGMASTREAQRVLNSPAQASGLPSTVLTLPRFFREVLGYRTAMVGKWHLGAHAPHDPIAHGFETFYGMPVTNVQSCAPDRTLTPEGRWTFFMRRTVHVWAAWLAVVALLYVAGVAGGRGVAAMLYLLVAVVLLAFVFSFKFTLLNPRSCYLVRGREVVEQPVRLQNLTVRLTNEALRLVREFSNADEPFFLYFPFVKVHTALFTSPRFTGVSAHGAFGDNVEEMDWAVGKVIGELAVRGLRDDTIVVFTSDNGPFLERGIEGGFAGYAYPRSGGERVPLKGGKAQTWEGGIRVPTIVSWPGEFLGNVSRDAPVTLMDLYPTLVDVLLGDAAALASHASLPSFDGKSLAPLLRGLTSESPHAVLFHYCSTLLTAVRFGKYKLHFVTPQWTDGQACLAATICPCDGEHHDPALLYDMDEDPGELRPLAPDALPDVRARVAELVRVHRESMQQLPASQLHSVPLPWLQPCCNWPRCECVEES